MTKAATTDDSLIEAIKTLIKHGEEDTLTYSVLEDARKLLFNIEQDGLVRIPLVSIVQSGEQFEKDQELFTQTVSDLTLTKDQLLRANQRVTDLYYYLSKFLDEFEAEFDLLKKCDSTEIAQDYLNTAVYMRDNFKRVNHRIVAIEEWIENYNPY